MARPEHFTRNTALRTGGWLARLNANEIAMWHVYEEFSGKDGLSSPGGSKIAQALGHANDNNVARIRKVLVDYNLIEIVEQGGGRGNPTKVRMLMPPQKQGDLFPTANPLIQEGVNQPVNPLTIEGVSDTKPPQTDVLNPLKIENKPPQTERAHNKEEQLIQQLNTTEKRAQAAPATTRKKSSDEVIAGIPIPATLDTPAFRTIWANWQTNRKELRKPITPLGAREQLSALEPYGELHAIATIKASIANGWQGLFPDKQHVNRGSQNGHRKPEHRSAKEQSEFKQTVTVREL